MSDNTKNPNPRNLGDYEEGLDDDFDVPTYRRIADDGPAADVAPDTTPDARTEAIAVPASQKGLAPEADAKTEIVDGTGAGPFAGGAEGADDTVAAATSASTGTADSDVTDSGETQVIPRRDIYAAAGRTAPQKIEPLAKTDDYREADADFAADEPTQVAPAPTGYDTAGSDNTDTGSVGAVGAVGAAGLGATAATAGRDSDSDVGTGTGYAYDHDHDRTSAAAAPVVGTADSDDRDFRDDDLDRDHDRDRDLDPRRGTLDFGLLLLRLGVGGMLLMLGLATFFQFGGAPGIGALEAQFADNGYNLAGIIAIAIPTVQVIAGGLLVLGLATPLGAALALAISAFLTMFEVAVGDSGWNVLAVGAEPVRLHLALTAAALALQFTGPGRYGIDFSRGWARRPLASSWIFCILAVAAAVGLWYLVAGQLPFVDTTTGATS
ncbi:DoxX family protein [Corynebacterium sp. NPDC060344]|uniref:DoxX family protein n=1 Tax=Corynebacterium sp. NPDC060344 TaxID=3347101 RepID=UPI00365D921A